MTPAKTSDDYAPCVAVWPGGKTQRANVKRIRLDTVEQARRKLDERDCGVGAGGCGHGVGRGEGWG